jgi:hypothetical protein
MVVAHNGQHLYVMICTIGLLLASAFAQAPQISPIAAKPDRHQNTTTEHNPHSAERSRSENCPIAIAF